MKSLESTKPKGINSRRSLLPESGEPPEIGSQLPPELSFLNEGSLAEHWLLSSGVVPESSIDTLLMYAYSQVGVAHVDIHIDQPENREKTPGVFYKVKLNPSARLKMDAMDRANKIRNVLIRKVAILALVKVGAPVSISNDITKYAKEYLPGNFKVEVEILNE